MKTEKWSKEKCLNEIKKYDSIKDFRENSRVAYEKSRINGWLEEFYNLCFLKRKTNFYWTKERCEKEAIKYNSRTEFCNKCLGAYRSSIKNSWIDEISSHMKQIGNLYNRCIYVYEFNDNYAYIGLTYDIEKRHLRHLKSGRVKEYISLNENYTLKKLTEYININDAKIQEQEYINYYRNNGWNILNIAKAGSIGGSTKIWIKEKCKIESLKYNNRINFCNNSSGAYRSALHNGWLDEICIHMNKRNEWIKEKCKMEALKYGNRFSFSKNCKSGYMSALRNGWLNEICSHMELKIRRDYWTKDKCKEESLKFKTKGEFSKKSPYAYKVSRINGWLIDFFKK